MLPGIRQALDFRKERNLHLLYAVQAVAGVRPATYRRHTGGRGGGGAVTRGGKQQSHEAITHLILVPRSRMLVHNSTPQYVSMA
jgi:hypothetical protein